MLENEFINLVDNDGLKMINKKIMIPLNKQELLEQHKFIGYLYNNGINTANIFKLYESDKHYYELQEYIENNNEKYTTKNIMKLLAKFHNVSKKYNLNFSKKKYYCHNFKCNDFELNKLLLGYDEKFHIYPLKNYNKYKKTFGFNDNERYVKIINYYNYCYSCLKEKFNNSFCIIHNDITKNNIINSDKGLFLIDFDLSNYSYEIVDIADAIMIPYNDLNLIINNFEELYKNTNDSIEEYNKYNNININTSDILFQIFVKIVSYNCYVVLNMNNKKNFEANFDRLYVIMNLIKEKCNVRN